MKTKILFLVIFRAWKKGTSNYSSEKQYTTHYLKTQAEVVKTIHKDEIQAFQKVR